MPTRSRATSLVLGSVASVQLGAAVSKTLFDDASPTTMVWLRLVTSAVVLLVAVRPSVRGRDGVDWATVLAYGAVLATMNWAIYQSFARIPLGIAVTIEFLGPLAVALVGSRRPLDVLWVVLAAAGVVLLGVQPTDLDLAGVLFALLAGAMWAAYIPLSAATGRRWPGLSGLALASVVGTVAFAPHVLVAGREGLGSADVVAGGVLVGLLSSVIPYSCELIALRVLPARVFGILMSLDPAAAAVAGMVVIGELLAPLQWVAVLCVVIASVGVTRAVRQPVVT